MFRNFFKSCLCSLLMVSLLASLTTPASAVSPDIVASLVGTDFFSWVADQTADVVGFIGSLFDKSVCGMNPNTDKRHDFEMRHTTVDGKTGYFYVCRFCGGSAGEVLEPAYNDYVDTLPASGCNSSGHIVWHSSIDDVLYLKTANYTKNMYVSDLPFETSMVSRISVNSSNSFRIGPSQQGTSNLTSGTNFSFWLKAPMDGSYRMVASPGILSIMVRLKEYTELLLVPMKKQGFLVIVLPVARFLHRLYILLRKELTVFILIRLEFFLFMKLFLILLSLQIPTTSRPARRVSQAATTA